MPQAIALAIVPYLATASVVGAIGFTGTAYLALGIGYALTGAALYGVSTLFRPDKPSVPKPEDGKYNLKQAVPSLPYALGRNLKGGDYLFLGLAGDGTAFHILCLAGHKVNGFLRYYLHDEEVGVDGSGQATSPGHFVGYVTILTRPGTDVGIPYTQAVTEFSPSWTNDHRGDGLATMLMAARTTAADKYQETYPYGMPRPTVEFQGNSQIYDPRTDSYGYSENLALLRLWHLTHPVGGKLLLADMYLPDWIAAANRCDEMVTNRADESEPRYHGGLWFRASDDQVKVGMLMDQAAELVVYERPDGLVGVHRGEFIEPDVRLTEGAIIALSFQANRKKASNVLAVRGRYTGINDRYVTVDAAIYGDPYIGDGTERSKTIENQAVQRHNHMQRLQKIAYIRANAPRVSVVADYHAAKNVPYQRFVRVHYPPRLDEAVIEVTGRPRLSLRDLTVTFEGIVVPEGLYNFDASIEEGAPGVVGAIIAPTERTLPVPTGFTLTTTERIINGQQFIYAVFTADEPSNPNDSILFEVSSDGGSTWNEVIHDRTVYTAEYGPLGDGITYSGRASTKTLTGRVGDPTDPPLTVSGIDVDPLPVATSLSASTTGFDVTVQWTTPNDSRVASSKVFRTETGAGFSETTPTSGNLYYGPNQTVSDVDTVPTIAGSGDIQSGQQIVYNVATTSLAVGMRVIGAGIPAETTIQTIYNATSMNLSLAATATTNGAALTFSKPSYDYWVVIYDGAMRASDPAGPITGSI